MKNVTLIHPTTKVAIRDYLLRTHGHQTVVLSLSSHISPYWEEEMRRQLDEPTLEEIKAVLGERLTIPVRVVE